MVVHLLGTGGADGVPALYSGSRVSQYARQHGGKDVRSRAAAVVDETLKLDFGPDTWHQVTANGLDARDWTGVVFTHSDADHFAVEELQYVLYPFNECELAEFTIYGNEAVTRTIDARYPDWPFELVTTRSYCPVRHAGYLLTPIRAKHGNGMEDAHNWIVQDGHRTLLYGTDTGVWEEETWEFLSDFRFDCLVLECSEGFVLTPYNGHLDIDEFRHVVARLRGSGIVDSGTKIVTTHHSHNGEATHEELCQTLEPFGVTVGYDGLKIEF
ncbi:MAG: hypothetical protein KIT11_04200 [Fimbriimonadaceae bacterium]|nr:hypothetical protein [Fimbriimonadaceae bacterium]QYK56903.1 MAG: hypothetical protein KF733_05325 [Fimbriimonadaceae bacterium]